MYVVFENVDIARPNDANYDSISPLCKVHMEFDSRGTTPYGENYSAILNTTKWKGYVRLRLREDPKQQRLLSGDSEDLYSEGSSGYGTTSPYSSKAKLNTWSTGSEQDYDYACISYLNTQHPLRELKMTNAKKQHIIDAKILPESCISCLSNFVPPLQEEEFKDDEDSESECEDGQESNRSKDYRDYDTQQAIKLYKTELEKRGKLLAQNYLNSREFMKYFGELVRTSLAQQLHITPTELDAATYRGSSIYTTKYELVPAIYVAQNVLDWPKCAFEFRLRERPISTNPRRGQQMQWPSRTMIKRIETFGFHVIPMGYAPKKKRNPFREIEWRITFPKAERYLEQHLTSPQVKVYMLTKALFKSFVEPLEKNKALMFALDHLRTHLFWECERDYNAWPEEFLGEVLLRFINSFKQRVKEKYLSDYFIRERNLFESIPEFSLNTLYAMLADITANPVIHVMIALRNLAFSDHLFPKLDFKKLYENLMENDILKLKMLAKNARSLTDLRREYEDESCIMPDEGAKGLVGFKQHHVRTNGILRRKTHLLRHNIEMQKQEQKAKQRSLESIDVEFFFKGNIRSANLRQLNQGMENLRRTNILEVIIDHLLEMAAKAIRFNAVLTAKTYLSLTRKLCKCYHNYGCDLGANEYLASIHNLDEELQLIYGKEEFPTGPPLLPLRISVKPALSEVPGGFPMNLLNLYEEMTPDTKTYLTSQTGEESCIDKISKIFENSEISSVSSKSEPVAQLKLPDPNKSINFQNVMTEVQQADTNTQKLVTYEKEIKSYLKDYSAISNTLCRNVPLELRKSLKFRDKYITGPQVDMNPIHRPRCYSPVSILKSKSDYRDKTKTNNAIGRKDDKQNKQLVSFSSYNYTHLLAPSYSRSLKSSSISNEHILLNISHNANQFLNQMTAEKKKVQIREMLKHKTYQLKGIFNQSSDS